MVTGLYSAMMNIGSMATLIGTGPLSAALGWRWALVTWGVLALIGLGFCILLIRFRVRREGAAVQGAEEASEASSGPEASSEPEAEQPWSQAPAAFRGIIALLVVTFSGQSIAYYVTTTWLPSYLADTIGLASASAGATASLFQISALLGAFGVPLLAARSKAWTPVAI